MTSYKCRILTARGSIYTWIELRSDVIGQYLCHMTAVVAHAMLFFCRRKIRHDANDRRPGCWRRRKRRKRSKRHPLLLFQHEKMWVYCLVVPITWNDVCVSTMLCSLAIGLQRFPTLKIICCSHFENIAVTTSVKEWIVYWWVMKMATLCRD